MTDRSSLKFRSLRPGHVLRLDETDHLGQSHHQWDQREIDALTLALAANRPLLVRGEPGTGKTQLARAAAQSLGWALVSCQRSTVALQAPSSSRMRGSTPAQYGHFPAWVPAFAGMTEGVLAGCPSSQP